MCSGHGDQRDAFLRGQAVSLTNAERIAHGKRGARCTVGNEKRNGMNSYSMRPGDPRHVRTALRAALWFQLFLICTGVAYSSAADAQDWIVAKEILVGEAPERAILTPNGKELYVSSRLGGTVSVIDTSTGTVSATLKLGNSPGTIIASHDGRRVYVLAENRLAIINTAHKDDIKYIAIPGRTDELALTKDDRRLYMTRVYAGVFYLDTTTGELQQATSDLCPIGIAISQDEQRMYVNYQCYGPGGYLAHDALGIYELPSHRLIHAITGLPNVGGQLTLSPDGSQLWADGNDACSRPDYPYDYCPGFPSRVVNVIATSDLKVKKSYNFSLEDGDGRISFSPDGKAFVGGGIFLKEVASNNLVDVAEVTRIPIANSGDVVFSADGKTAYVTVSDKNAIYVMQRAKAGTPGNYGRAAALSLTTIVGVLSNHSNYGQCMANGQCVRVTPQVLAPVLAQRGDESTRQCGQEIEGRKIRPSEVYRCIANVVLGTSGLWSPETTIDLAMDLRALEANEDYLEWKVYKAKREEAEKLSQKPIAELTADEQRRLKILSDYLKKAEHDNGIFNDVTFQLYDRSGLQKALGDSAVAISVFSWGGHTYTVLLSKSEKILQEDKYQGKPLDWNTLRTTALRFQEKLQSDNSDANPPVEAKDLYLMLIGSLDAKLRAYLSLAPQQKLTLVWMTEGELRNIPTAALFDGEQYLAEKYSNVLETTPSMTPRTNRGALTGLAAGTTHGWAEGNLILDPQPELGGQLESLFSDQQPPESGKIPAKILLDTAFTSTALSTGLHQLQTNKNDNLFVHIASHFFLAQNADDSFLLLGDRSRSQLKLSELIDESNFPFQGLSLVIFSACKTAAGGEIESLAFDLEKRGNGAHAVLATLWEIEPQYAFPLIENFYDELRKGKSKAEALQAAELSLLKSDDKTQRLHYWAPFILIGDWH